ncbi:MAG: S8 family serine peptidase [Anaerolineaceae bacterium]|nr:S8 family serine peptidase [Anaerolineaceae bacterium]
MNRNKPMRRLFLAVLACSFFLALILPGNSALGQEGADATATLPLESPTQETATPTSEPEHTPTEEPTALPTDTPEAEPTLTETQTPTLADAPTLTQTQTQTATPTSTLTPTATAPLPLISVTYPENAEIVPDRYIVTYRSDLIAANSAAAIKANVAKFGGKVSEVYRYALNGYGAYLPRAALQQVLADPNVLAVEAEVRYSVDSALAATTQTNPTWGLDRIDQRITTMSNSYYYAYTGSGVNVYILDTGINAENSQFGGRASRDYDAVADGQNGKDCNGHGTAVAGVIGGSTYGVAKKANLHSIRVFGCDGTGTTSQLLSGINWVISQHKHPAIANFSFSGPISDAVDQAVTAMYNHGIVVVAAAGNDNGNACSYSPGKVPDVLTVGATTRLDARADYSNQGACLDLFAPGSDVLSAWIGSTTAKNTLSGTSMAAPFVSGVAALYLQTHTSVSPRVVVKSILTAVTTDMITNINTESPNKLIYSLIGVTEPSTPIIVAPIGSSSDSTPIFTWGKIANATQYQLLLYKNNKVLLNKVIPTTECTGYYCTYTAPYYLANATYKWQVRSYTSSTWRTYTKLTSFALNSQIPGFISDFAENYDGWKSVKGTWSIVDGSLYTPGALSTSYSIVHENNYPTVDFSVTMKREGDKSGANRVTIYGKPTPFIGSYHWYEGFTFQYTNDQKFLIYKSVGGDEDVVVPWTASNYIKPYDWNTIRIQADVKTHLLKFYINGHLIAYGTDTSLWSGRVGMGVYQTVTNTPFYVTSAVMITPYDTGLTSIDKSTDAIGFSASSAIPQDTDINQSP